jgi:hypothetical protein
MSTAGFIEEHALEMDIPYDIKWEDFVSLAPVQSLLKERPALNLLDITPEDMLYNTATPEHDEPMEIELELDQDDETV